MSGPREWSPRGNFKKVMKELLKDLKNSGQSESIAIADVLDSAHEDPDFDFDLAMAILGEFESWSQYAKDKLKKVRPG
jgi:hypothetical protein